VASAILTIVLFPIRAIAWPFRSLLKRLDDLDVLPSERSRHQRRSLFKRLILFPLLFLTRPLRQFDGATRNPKELIYMLPAFSVIGFLGFVTVQTTLRSGRIDQYYQSGAIEALKTGDFRVANTYVNRIVARGNLADFETYELAVALLQSKQFKRANELFDRIAPNEGSSGFPPAHRLKAFAIAKNLGNTKDKSMIESLKWHLSCSEDKSAEADRAWATYYNAIGDSEEAVNALQRQVASHPNHYLIIAQLYKELQQDSKHKSALEKAKVALLARVSRDAHNNTARISAASAMIQLNELDEAEQLLERGIKMNPDPVINRTTASFFIKRFDDLEKQAPENIGVRFEYLTKAIAADPNYASIYDRLMGLSNVAPSKLRDVREVIEKSVSNKPSSIGHFALSDIYRKKGDDELSIYHLEKAYQLNNNLVVVLNNLAWGLAHQSDPDFTRAIALSRTAVEKEPNNAQYHDTLGTILMKSGQYEEAIDELKVALAGIEKNADVHRKLAIAYKALDMTEQAELHKKQIQPEAPAED